MRTCLRCSQPTKPRNGWEMLYCGKVCLDAAREDGTLVEGKNKNTIAATCSVCKLQFFKDSRRRRLTCSAICTAEQIRRTKMVLPDSFYLMDPWRRVYRVSNVEQFVRDHSDLFAWCDVRPLKNKTSVTTNAARSLARVKIGRIAQWNGWRLATKEQFETE